MNNNSEQKFPLSFGIVGVGQLGCSLIDGLIDKANIDWILARSDASFERAKQYSQNKVKIVRNMNEIEALPDISLIAVSDNQIEKVSDEFCKAFKSNLKDKHFIHFSGFLGKSMLGNLLKCGAKISATHPYQTLFYPSSKNFFGTGFGVESDDNEIFDFVTLLGGIPYSMTAEMVEKKALYHCSAIAASNFTNVALNFSKLLTIEAGIPAELFIPPIIKKTIENFFIQFENTYSDSPDNPSKKHGSFPLSGPIARGDAQAVKRHLDLLSFNASYKKIYAHLSLATAELTLLNGLLSDEKYISICEILDLAIKE